MSDDWEDAPVPDMPLSLPPQVTFFEPMELFVPVSTLRKVTLTNLNTLMEYMGAFGESLTDDQRKELDQARHQREAFLTWLDELPPDRDQIFMAWYPVEERLLKE